MQKDYPAMQKEKNYLRVKKVKISAVHSILFSDEDLLSSSRD
jgi:hypothetical protein